MAGSTEGFISGASGGVSAGVTLGAAAGSIVPGVGTAIGAVAGAVIGGAVTGTFGMLSGRSASRAKKWMRIAKQREAEYAALQNRRSFLQSLRSVRSQRAAQVQAGSGDIMTAVSGQQGALASIGSQFESAYTMFDRDLWYQDYINAAYTKAGQAQSAATKYTNIQNLASNLLSTASKGYNMYQYQTAADQNYADIREQFGAQQNNSSVRYTTNG